ncbi:MAG: MFS transporter [Chloroflexota bacterium]|nr:MAG: MFS transporter [Chloroflexota bacterium]
MSPFNLKLANIFGSKPAGRPLQPCPETPLSVQKRNFLNVQIYAVGIGLASAAAPFLPVFLTLLGATNVQVGLLTSMPAITGLFLAIFIGNFLQGRRKIVPWFSAARLMVISSYALTGLMPFIVPPEYAVVAVLAIWAIATLPQTMVAVAFSVVMNAVAGPEGRYALMSRRWSILGLTTAITVFTVGQILGRIKFPINYQVVFMGLSLGGLISFYFSSHIKLPDADNVAISHSASPIERIKDYAHMILRERPFVSFAARRFVFLSGTALAAPLFPLYYVREVHASNAWIGLISTSQTAVLLFGYFLWTRESKVRGSRFVLLCTTLALSIYPALTAVTHRVELIAIYAGFAGIFQAGIDLVFFDELMKTVPVKYSATFVSLAQSLGYLSSIAAPLLGTWMADYIGLGGALIVSAVLRLAGFMLFASSKPALVAAPIPPLLPPPGNPSRQG